MNNLQETIDLLSSTLLTKIEQDLSKNNAAMEVIKDEIKSTQAKVSILENSKAKTTFEKKKQELQDYIDELKQIEDYIEKWNKVKQDLEKKNYSSKLINIYIFIVYFIFNN